MGPVPLLLLELPNVLDERLLMDKTCVLAIPKHANISQTQLDEALIDEVHWGMNVKCDRRLEDNH